MINIDKPHGDVVMIGKCYEGVISQTAVIANAKRRYRTLLTLQIKSAVSAL